MTILSTILGIIATVMPIILEALNRKTKPVVQNYLVDLQEAYDEEDIEIVWAEHDADIEQLL